MMDLCLIFLVFLIIVILLLRLLSRLKEIGPKSIKISSKNKWKKNKKKYSMPRTMDSRTMEEWAEIAANPDGFTEISVGELQLLSIDIKNQNRLLGQN